MSPLQRNELFPAFNHLFDDFLTRELWDTSNNSTTSTTIPAVNISENTEQYKVEMAAPGMTKTDFTIELNGNMLTITSHKNEEQIQKDGERYTRREFSYQSFQRTFQLHKDVVDADKIHAKYENGVLHLIIPKKEAVRQQPRMIQIS